MKMMIEFYDLAHSLIEGKIATKVGDCISDEINNFSCFPRFASCGNFQCTEVILCQFQHSYCDISPFELEECRQNLNTKFNIDKCSVSIDHVCDNVREDFSWIVVS